MKKYFICIFYYTARDLTKYLAWLNTSQISVLEEAFVANDWYPNRSTLMQLAQQTGLDEKRICRWFTYRRRYIRCERKKGKIPYFGKAGENNLSVVA